MSTNTTDTDSEGIDTQQGVAGLFPQFGVTEEGTFQRPGLDLLYEAFVAEAEQNLGRTLVSPFDPAMQYVDIAVLLAYYTFEVAEANYYAATYRNARGPQLDAHLDLPGFDRQQRREATGEVTFVAAGATENQAGDLTGGNPRDRTIPEGMRVATKDGPETPPIIFATTEPVTLPSGQPTVNRVPIQGLSPLSQRADLSSEQTGEATNVPAEAIVRLLDTVRGVSDVTNPLPTGSSGVRSDGSGEAYDFVAGRDRETDAAYRRRWENSRGRNGVATLEGIESAIREAGDDEVVRDVQVRENFTDQDERDSGGLPPHSVGPLVWFEEDTEPNRDAVHQAILDATAGGIEGYGSVDGSAFLHKGTEYEREYPRPGLNITDGTGDTRSGLGFGTIAEISVYVTAEVVVTSEFPADGVDRIQNEIVEYIGGTRTDGRRVAGEGIGDDIYGDHLQGILQNPEVHGVRDVTGEPGVAIGTSETPSGKSDVVVGLEEVAVTSPSQLAITTTPGEIQ